MTSDQPESATDSDIDLDVLDEAMVAKLVDLDDGRVGLFSEMVELFRVAVHEHLDELDQGVANGDAVAALRMAHAICGESASMGATRVERQARELEQLATEQRLESAPARAAALRRSVDHCIVAMDGEIARRTCGVA